MTINFIPPAGWHKRTLISDAYVTLFAEQDVDWFITLNFNRYATLTLPGVRSKFREWLARIDRQFLGRNWCRRGDERAFAIAVVEHPQTNVHIHALLRMPTPARGLRRPDQSHSMTKHWRDLVPGGQCVEDLIYAKEGVARYMSKELPLPEHLEDCLIISTEFHNFR